MADRIVLLGTGTCQLQSHRMASSVLLELDGLRLVYDFGRGIAGRVAEIGLKQDDLEHVVLSHFHPDHLSDLIPFLQAAAWSRIDPRGKDLHLYGPIGLEVQLMRLLSLFGPETLVRDHYRVHLHEHRSFGPPPAEDSFGPPLAEDSVGPPLAEDSVGPPPAGRTDQLVVGGHAFDFVDLPPADNRGLRFSHRGRTYAFTGDSDFHQPEIEFLRGVELAIIDAGHPEDEEILRLAAETQVPRIVCSHLYRELDEEEMNVRAGALGYTGRLIVGQDLMSFEI